MGRAGENLERQEGRLEEVHERQYLLRRQGEPDREEYVMGRAVEEPESQDYPLPLLQEVPQPR